MSTRWSSLVHQGPPGPELPPNQRDTRPTSPRSRSQADCKRPHVWMCHRFQRRHGFYDPPYLQQDYHAVPVETKVGRPSLRYDQS